MSNKHIVSLQEVAEQLEMLFDGWYNYYNIKTGEFESYNPDFSENDFDPEERYESEEYIMLPSSYDIHEYNIMERFVGDIIDSHAQEMLEVALNGRGAFQKFKDVLLRLGLRDDWFNFKHHALLDIAREWCTCNNIKYKEDEK